MQAPTRNQSKIPVVFITEMRGSSPAGALLPRTLRAGSADGRHLHRRAAFTYHMIRSPIRLILFENANHPKTPAHGTRLATHEIQLLPEQ